MSIRPFSSVVGVLVLVVACGQSGPCRGGECVCRGGERCDFACDVPGCDVTCESLTTCNGSCGDACGATCTSLDDCDLACGDACTLVCESASSCAIDCGTDCDFTCRSAATCVARMVSGVTTCISVGSCDVRCTLPDGSTEDAIDCGGGVFACGACP